MKLATPLTIALFLLAPAAAAQAQPSDDEVCLLGACSGETAEEAPPVEPRPEPVPPEGRYETTTYLPLTIAGACTFGAAWVATIALASASVATEEPTIGADGQAQSRDVGPTVGAALVPVAGPVLLRSTGGEPRDDTVDDVLVVLMGVQAMGLLATVLGATIDSRVEVPATAIVPSVTPNGAGVIAVGRF